MGPWSKNEDVAESVRTQIGVNELDPRWDGIIPGANQRAWQQIQTALMGKGYPVSQIDAWDFCKSHSLDLATVKALINGGSLTDFDMETLLQRERNLLKEIADLPALSINGVLVFPAGATADGGGLLVTGGQLDQSGWRLGWDTQF